MEIQLDHIIIMDILEERKLKSISEDRIARIWQMRVVQSTMGELGRIINK